MKRLKILAVIFFVGLCVLPFTTDPLFGIRYSTSPSLPYKLFISRPASSLKRNQYVTATHPKSKILVAKQIAGLPGDEIVILDKTIYVNDNELGLIQENSKSGKKLQPISEGKIPEGHIFLYAPHTESFDSRYKEFGLVSTDQIKEVLWPLF